MRPRTFVVLALVTTLLLGPALASVPGPALLSNPQAPTGGRYLRLDDNWWVDWNKYTRTVTPIGPAPVGDLFSETVTCHPTGQWCETEEGTCTWTRGPWTEPSMQSDFNGGRCIELRTTADGADAHIQFRPAARAALLAALNNENPSWSWTYRLVIRWHDTEGPMDPQWSNGVKINPTTVNVTLNGCTVDPDDQQAPLQGAHWFMDCVWAASPILKVDARIPAQLDRIDGRPIIGYDAQAFLTLTDGGSNTFDYVAGVQCGDCFDEDPL